MRSLLHCPFFRVILSYRPRDVWLDLSANFRLSHGGGGGVHVSMPTGLQLQLQRRYGIVLITIEPSAQLDSLYFVIRVCVGIKRLHGWRDLRR